MSVFHKMKRNRPLLSTPVLVFAVWLSNAMKTVIRANIKLFEIDRTFVVTEIVFFRIAPFVWFSSMTL